MEYKYVQFPLCLMQEVIKDRKRGLDLCLNYGIGHYAMSQKPNIDVIARRLVYDYYRNNEALPWTIKKTIEEAEENETFTFIEDYACFDINGKFEGTENIEEIVKLLTEYPELKKEATKHTQWHGAELHFNISANRMKGIIRGYDEARGIKERYESNYGPDAMPSVKPSTLREFRDDPKSDIDLLLAYIGIRSLIGHREFISSSKPVILSRMVGAKSKASFEAAKKLKGAEAIINKYSKRWPMDKLLLTLAERKFIMYLTRPHVSVVYVSNYMEPDKLADLISKSRKKYELLNRIKSASKKI